MITDKFILGLVIVLSSYMFSSCAKEDDVKLSSNNAITTIKVRSSPDGVKEYIGVLADDNENFYFDIPVADWDAVDITKLTVIATIPVDATITPGLSGLSDLSEPLMITVTAGDNSTKNYFLLARYQ